MDHAPQRMAEPMHRIPPPGVTSMASLRDVPKSCIQKVKDICLFYVEKCSGEYINNRTAARYVHHMADEIISQLSGVADEIKRNRTDPEMFQALIDEWNAYFPKTLHNLGSPKQVALLLKQQETTILQLQDELAKVKAKRTGDVEDLLKSMDNQLQSYKHSVLLERNHLKTQIDGVIANYTTQLEECKKYFEEDKAALIKQYEKMLADLQERYDEEKSGNEQQFRQKHDAIFRKLDYVQTLSRKKIDLMKEKNEFYKEKYTKLCKKYKLLVNSIAINKKELQEINDEIDEDLLAVSDDSNNALDTDDLSSLEALDFDAQATGTTAATSSSSGSFGVSSGGRASAGYGAALQTPTQSATGGLQNTSSHSQSPSAVGTGSRRRSSIVRDIAASYSEEKKEKLRLEEANLFANAQIQALQTVSPAARLSISFCHFSSVQLGVMHGCASRMWQMRRRSTRSTRPRSPYYNERSKP